MKEKGFTLLEIKISNRKNKRFLTGFSLVEMLVILAIFSSLLAALFTLLTDSNRSWRIGQNKLIEQQEARKAMGQITRLLRQSSPRWIQSSSTYPISITSGSRIDFYVPSFDAEGEISAFRKITFKLDPDEPRHLLKKEGVSNEVVVAQEIESINFGGGCAGCASFSCSSVADDCPQVEIEIRTKRPTEVQEYILNSLVTLRNVNVAIADGLEVEAPPEGEF